MSAAEPATAIDLAHEAAFSLCGLEVRPSTREVLAGDKHQTLEPRIMQVFVALARRRGEVVSRDDLIRSCWGGLVVGEDAINRAVAGVRRVADAYGGFSVATIARVGYLLTTGEPSDEVRLPHEKAEEQASAPARASYALPPASDRTVGRDKVVRELSEKLRSERFVTIVGAGGVGKTTVALTVANALLREFAGAVCFVDLSSIGEPGLVAATVASAFGVPVQAEDPLPALIARLRRKKTLLVIDNCEHLIGAAAELAGRLADQLDRLYILATSREAMRAEREHTFLLPPLESPPEGVSLSAAQALAYPSAQLFANCMESAGAGGALSIEQTSTIGRMCRQLGGLPLAIELAASRAALLGVHDTEDQLNSLFALRWPGRRTAPPRQQTLSATLDWSYNLLSGDEKAALRRLSVFSGGFTLDAAQGVALGGDIERAAFYDVIANLVSKSLLSSDRSDPVTRYRLLDACRDYARQKLDEAGERGPTTRRHALYYRDLLASTAAAEGAPDLPAASTVDLEDVRSSLQWAFGAAGDVLLGADIAAYSAPLWLGRALLAEGHAWMAKAAEAAIDAGGATTQQQLTIQVAFASSELFTHGFAETTITAFDKILERAIALNAVQAQLLAYVVLWGGEIRAAQYVRALKTAEKCAAAVKDLSDPGSLAQSEWMLGHSKHCTAAFRESRGHLERYLSLETEAARVAMLKATGYDRLVGALGVLSNTLCFMGWPDQARAMGRRAVADARSLGFAIPIGLAMSCAILNTYLLEPDLEVLERDAVELLEHATTHSIDGDAGFARCLLGLAQTQRGDFEAGAHEVSKGLATFTNARLETFSVLMLAHICEASLLAGRRNDAITWMERIKAEGRNEDHWCSSEVLRIQGLLAQSNGDESAAAGLLSRSIAVARQQGALSWELRSTLSLSKLRAEQGRTVEALEVLLAVYGRYAEGFGTRDLILAKRLIGELS